MSSPVRGRAETAGRRPRPPAGAQLVRALVAIPGGAVEGAGFGAVTAFAVFLPDQLLNPASEGGTGSPGSTVLTVVIGLVVGAFAGGVLGTAGAASLVIAWTLDLGLIATAGLGGTVVALGLAAWFAVVPPDPGALVVAGVGVAHAAVGLAVLDVWARLPRPAGARPNR